MRRRGRRFSRALESCSGKRNAITGLRLAVGIIFLWFGIPKFFAGGSPAESLAVRTVHELTLGAVDGGSARVLVASVEVAIALVLLSGKADRLAALLMTGHLAGACAPLVLFPDETWRSFGVGTIEGQYMIKNVVLVAAAVVIAAHSGERRRALPTTRA